MRQNHRLRVFEKRDIPFVHLFPDQGQIHISQTEFGGFSRHHRHPSLGSVSAIHRSFVSISISSGGVRTLPPLAKGWPSLTPAVAGRDKVLLLQFTLRTPYPSVSCLLEFHSICCYRPRDFGGEPLRRRSGKLKSALVCSDNSGRAVQEWSLLCLHKMIQGNTYWFSGIKDQHTNFQSDPYVESLQKNKTTKSI